jgi:hypothetical protein
MPWVIWALEQDGYKCTDLGEEGRVDVSRLKQDENHIVFKHCRNDTDWAVHVIYCVKEQPT